MEKSLDQIISTFALKDDSMKSKIKDGGPVTIWLPKEYKTKYDKIQRTTDRRFCKKIRELIVAAIDITESQS